MTLMAEKEKRHSTPYVMTNEEKEQREATKAVHEKLRAPLREGKSGDRYDLLAWAFFRGLPFRRCERSHRIQTCGGKPADRYGRPVAQGEAPYEHNLPDASRIEAKLVAAGVAAAPTAPATTFARIATVGTIDAWLADPNGALPLPKPRPKRPRGEAARVAPVAPLAEIAAKVA